MKKENISSLLMYFIVIFLTICNYSCSEQNNAISTDNSTDKKGISAQHELNIMGQWMNEGKRENMVKTFVHEYSFLNQEVHINLKFPEEIGFDRHNTLSTHEFIGNLITSPNPDWDVVLINDDFEGIKNHLGDAEWAKKYLVDFSQYPEFLNNTIAEIDIEKVKQRWGGIIPGPFIEGQYWALWTNKIVTNKLGIEVKQYGMTVDDFIHYIKTVDNYNKTHTDHITPLHEAADWSTAFALALNIYLSEMGNIEDIFDKKVTEKKLNAWYKTLQVLEQLAAYNILDNNWQTTSWNDTKFQLLDEECLFYSNGSWMYNIWAQKDENKVMNCIPNEYPTFGKSPLYPAGYSIIWGVPKNSPNKEQAVNFLLAMNHPSVADLWVMNTKSPTGIKGKMGNVNFGTDQFESFSYTLQKSYGSNTYKNQENSSMIFNNDLMYEPNYYKDVLMGKLTADDAMKLIRSNLKRYLK